MMDSEGRQFVAKKADGADFHPYLSIFPIYKEYRRPTETEPPEFDIIGTGFFVTPCGHFITAKHLMEELPVDANGHCHHRAFIYQIHHSQRHLHRFIQRMFPHPVADLMLCEPEFVKDDASGQLILCDIPRLSAEDPKPGEAVATYAYDRATRRMDEQKIALAPKFIEGNFVESHPGGALGKQWPMYQVNLTIPGGTSGGPVFDSHGRVVGVNSFNYHGTDITFVSRIREALELPVPDMPLPGREKQTYALGELLERLRDLGLLSSI